MSVKSARPGSAGRIRGWLVVVLASVLGVGGGYAVHGRAFRARLAAARSLLDAGKPAEARQHLLTLLKQQPHSNEALYLLGLCQKAQGRIDLAVKTWEKIDSSSPYKAPCLLEHILALAAAGRTRDAEELASRSLANPQLDPGGFRWFLAPLYWSEGRRQEALACLRANWESLDWSRSDVLDHAVKIVHMDLDWMLQAHAAELSPPSPDQSQDGPQHARRQLWDRLRLLHNRDQPGRDAPELARISGALGLPFEAQAYRRIARAAGWSQQE